jgi:hypothetical protein
VGVRRSECHNRTCVLKSQPQRVHMLRYPGHPESATGVPSICQGTHCGTLFQLLSIPVIVPNLAVQAMQVESSGDRPRAIGIFKGSSEQGRRRCSRARAALRPRAAQSPVERPLRVVPHFGLVSYTISSTLRHIPRSGEQNCCGRDD